MWKKIKYIVCATLLLVFLLTTGYVLIARNSDTTPSLFGYSVLRVQSDSMEPELNTGNIIIIKKTAADKLKIADVISYNGYEYPVSGTLVTNQIVEIRQDGEDFYFTTRGIKSGAINDPEIGYSQIHGKVLYKIPFLGTLYDFFSTPYGILAFIAILIIPFVGEIRRFFFIIRNGKEEVDLEIPKNSVIPEFDNRFNDVLTQEVDELLKDLDEDNN